MLLIFLLLVFSPTEQKSGIAKRKDGSGTQKRCDAPEVFFESKCYSLLTQGPCPPNQSIVEIKGKVKCSKTKCRFPDVLINGNCHDYKKFHDCSKGMSLHINADGTGECDCLPGYLYHSTSGKCFEAYRQGPCKNSEYLVLLPGTKVRIVNGTSREKPTCVKNPCKTDGNVCYGPQCSSSNPKNNCVALNSKCQSGYVVVEWESFKITCTFPSSLIDPRVIGNVPSFECSPGSKRDISGVCRKTTKPNIS